MDITMCRDYNCPKREKCLRYNAKPNDFYQSYFVESPKKNITDTNKKFCDYYIQTNVIDVSIIDKLNNKHT